MNIAPKFHGDRPLIAIEYNYRLQEIQGFINEEGYGRTVPGFPYLSSYSINCSNVSINPIIYPHVVCRQLSSFNVIYKHNRMWKCDLALEKYWVTHSGYFSFTTTVTLSMGITDGNL